MREFKKAQADFENEFNKVVDTAPSRNEDDVSVDNKT